MSYRKGLLFMGVDVFLGTGGDGYRLLRSDTHLDKETSIRPARKGPTQERRQKVEELKQEISRVYNPNSFITGQGLRAEQIAEEADRLLLEETQGLTYEERAKLGTRLLQ